MVGLTGFSNKRMRGLLFGPQKSGRSKGGGRLAGFHFISLSFSSQKVCSLQEHPGFAARFTRREKPSVKPGERRAVKTGYSRMQTRQNATMGTRSFIAARGHSRENRLWHPG